MAWGIHEDPMIVIKRVFVVGHLHFCNHQNRNWLVIVLSSSVSSHAIRD
jgi:hypothetical protein